jgi:hypothetical protein
VDEQRNYAMRSTAQTTASRSTPRAFIHSARTENFVARQKGFVATEKERFSVTHNGTATTDTGYRDAIARCSLEPSDMSASACAYVQTCGR